VRGLIVRAGDFFGPRAGNNWLSQGLVQPGRPLRRSIDPGTRGAGHAWAHLPDVARTMRLLIERPDRLARFARFNFAGHWDADGTQMVAAIRRAALDAGAPEPKRYALPWWALRLAAPLVPLLREMHEMRYLWQQPVRLDNRRLVAELGAEPHTPLDDAVRETLLGLGCPPLRLRFMAWNPPSVATPRAAPAAQARVVGRTDDTPHQCQKRAFLTLSISIPGSISDDAQPLLALVPAAGGIAARMSAGAGARHN
jgi:hypothetical protein